MRKLFLFVLSLYLISCGGRKNVFIDTLRPAEINVSQDIKTVLVLDRTMPSKKNQWLTIGEGVLTGEGLMADRAAAQELVNSLKNTLQRSPRYKVVIASERLEGNSLTAVFPDPLSLTTQNTLLRRYGADAIVALEILDSDFIVTEGQGKVNSKASNRENRTEAKEEAPQWQAEGVGNIKVGIRMYDPKNRNLIDQQLLSKTNTWKATGKTKAHALAALIGKEEATRDLCRRLGHDYAFKIAPMPIKLNRSFFTKSKESDALEHGGRLAEVGNWQESIEVWEKGIHAAQKPKDKARMAYNIAVAYEVLNDLPQALEWSQKAYSEYGSKDGRNYAQQLQARIQDEEIVENQLKK